MSKDESVNDGAKCFVPEMLIEFIRKNLMKGNEGLEPGSLFFNGVCLLVDISGFTKLSGEFCSNGKSGIDELQLATNGYMGKLVEAIYKFGGEIIKFAGDAIICVFSAAFITAVSGKENDANLKRGMGSSSSSTEEGSATQSPGLSSMPRRLSGQGSGTGSFFARGVSTFGLTRGTSAMGAISEDTPTSFPSELYNSTGMVTNGNGSGKDGTGNATGARLWSSVRNHMMNRNIYSNTGGTGGGPGGDSGGNNSSIARVIRILSRSSARKRAAAANVVNIPPDVILRAMHCAEVLKDIQTDKLTVHVGMSCGEMCFGILGGFENRWECLISGPCIHQLSGCLDDAPSKQAVMSAQCGRILQRFAYAATTDDPNTINTRIATNVVSTSGTYTYTLETLPTGNLRIGALVCENEPPTPTLLLSPQASTLTKEQHQERQVQVAQLVGRFVPAPIAEELENAHLAGSGAGLSFFSEIREVTTMFMKVQSI